MGEDAYLGVATPPGSAGEGFSDEDVIEASKALSGWTISWGQYIGDDETGDDQYSESTGEFLYNEQQHSQETGGFMGDDLSGLTEPLAQGLRVIEIAALHPATARFVCNKICTRFLCAWRRAFVTLCETPWKDPTMILRVWLLTLTILVQPMAHAAAQGIQPVQAQHVRTMIVTCKVEETMRFYRDVLGMDVIRDDGGAPVQVAPMIIDMPDTSLMRMTIFVGKGEYPAGPIIGSRIGMLGLLDPEDPACAEMNRPNRRTRHGDVVLPVRVSNTEEILKRARAMGVEIIKEGPSPSRRTIQTLLYDPNGIVLELFELNVTPIP